MKLDRKLSRDDNRGLGQGVQDSKLTRFKVSRVRCARSPCLTQHSLH